jgi:shikimate kinase
MIDMITSKTGNKSLTKNPNRKKRPLIIEIAGPAGAGKTTLAKALSQGNENIIISPVPRVRKARTVPLFIRQALALLPIFLWHGPNSRWFTWREIKMMMHVNGWDHILSWQASSNYSVIVLDHGPVYRLAALHGFGPEVTLSCHFQKWSDRMLNRWAAILDMLIWLDAPNPVLAERINNRDTRHIVKGKPEQEMYNFLARFRASYEQVVSLLITRPNSPGVLRFKTDQETLDQVIDKVLHAIEIRLRDMNN